MSRSRSWEFWVIFCWSAGHFVSLGARQRHDGMVCYTPPDIKCTETACFLCSLPSPSSPLFQIWRTQLYGHILYVWSSLQFPSTSRHKKCAKIVCFSCLALSSKQWRCSILGTFLLSGISTPPTPNPSSQTHKNIPIRVCSTCLECLISYHHFWTWKCAQMSNFSSSALSPIPHTHEMCLQRHVLCVWSTTPSLSTQKVCRFSALFIFGLFFSFRQRKCAVLGTL